MVANMKKILYLLCMIITASLVVSCSGKKENNNTNENQDNIENSENITLSIDEIKDDYFMAQHPWPSPIIYKVYTKLDKKYCVGDYVDVYYKNMTETEEGLFEITAVVIKDSNFKLEEEVAYKPVIYLYPTTKTEVSVSLNYNGILTHTYPEYTNGWNVTAYPDGTILDEKGIQYPYLFWEGKSNMEYDMTKGYCISGDKTEAFLREKLSFMGLSQKELEDFLDFWLRFMKDNPYNKICFQTTCYTENAQLNITPKPDSILRVYMVFQPLDEFLEIEEQSLSKFDRRGFSVVEWGGSIIN